MIFESSRIGLAYDAIELMEKSSRFINFGIFYRKSISKINTEDFKGSWIETLFLHIAVPFDVERRQEDKNIHGTSNGKIIFLFENVDFLRFSK